MRKSGSRLVKTARPENPSLKQDLQESEWGKSVKGRAFQMGLGRGWQNRGAPPKVFTHLYVKEEVGCISSREVRLQVLVLLHKYGEDWAVIFLAVKPARNATWQSNKDYLKIQVWLHFSPQCYLTRSFCDLPSFSQSS